MDTLNEQGVWFINKLQVRALTHQPTVDVFVTLPQYFADPDTLVIFVFPLLLAFNRWLACRFALAIGMIDMVNTVLKWILQGDRPYWWVHEMNRTGLPTLEHHPLTCETGPGNPSGHAMTSAAVGFILVSAFIDQCVSKHVQQSKRKAVEGVLWFLYAFGVAFIGIARLRLATHFPHQVLAGAFAGLVGGWIVWNLPIERLQRKHFFTFAISLLVWAVVTFFGLQLLGVDPGRTLQLALKHCAERKYVKMSTTPWHSVYRNLALMMVTGYCATTPTWTNLISQVRQFNLKEKLSIAAFSFAIAQAAASIPYPHEPSHVFYFCAVIKNAVIVLACLLAVPLGVMYANGSITVQSTTTTAPTRKLTATANRQG